MVLTTSPIATSLCGCRREVRPKKMHSLPMGAVESQREDTLSTTRQLLVKDVHFLSFFNRPSLFFYVANSSSRFLTPIAFSSWSKITLLLLLCMHKWYYQRTLCLYYCFCVKVFLFTKLTVHLQIKIIDTLAVSIEPSWFWAKLQKEVIPQSSNECWNAKMFTSLSLSPLMLIAWVKVQPKATFWTDILALVSSYITMNNTGYAAMNRKYFIKLPGHCVPASKEIQCYRCTAFQPLSTPAWHHTIGIKK